MFIDFILILLCLLDCEKLLDQSFYFFSELELSLSAGFTSYAVFAF